MSLGEMIENLKEKYISVKKAALTIGVTDDELRVIGRAVRLLTYNERKRLFFNFFKAYTEFFK
jgi:hypothetical protein